MCRILDDGKKLALWNDIGTLPLRDKRRVAKNILTVIVLGFSAGNLKKLGLDMAGPLAFAPGLGIRL